MQSLADPNKSVPYRFIVFFFFRSEFLLRCLFRFFACLQISYLAVKAVTSFIKNHEKENNLIMSFRDCLPLFLKVCVWDVWRVAEMCIKT